MQYPDVLHHPRHGEGPTDDDVVVHALSMHMLTPKTDAILYLSPQGSQGGHRASDGVLPSLSGPLLVAMPDPL